MLRLPNVGATSKRERAPATGLVAPNSELSVTRAALADDRFIGFAKSIVSVVSLMICPVLRDEAIVRTCRSYDVRMKPPPNSMRVVGLNGYATMPLAPRFTWRSMMV